MKGYSNLIDFVKAIFKHVINIFPTFKNVILFEAVDFGDNSKVLYDRLNELGIAEKYRITWIVRDVEEHRKLYPNIRFVSKDSVSYRFFYRIFAAYCYSSLFPVGIQARKGQIRCYLTHGLSFKDTSSFYQNMDFYTHIISTSEFAAEIRCRTFQGGKDNIHILGYPRTDLLFQDTGTRKRMGIAEYSRLIIWMPTFKHYIDGMRNDGGDSENDVPVFLNDEELLYLNTHLREKNIFLMIKFHPGQNMKFVKMISYSNIGTYVNQSLREKGVDVYEILAESDGLITDFSSVYTDYLLCDKPIGFDVSGIESYKLGFSVDNPMAYMPGIKIRTMKDLLDFADIVVSGKDPFLEERVQLKNKMHQYADGRSADRIIEFFNL